MKNINAQTPQKLSPTCMNRNLRHPIPTNTAAKITYQTLQFHQDVISKYTPKNSQQQLDLGDSSTIQVAKNCYTGYFTRGSDTPYRFTHTPVRIPEPNTNPVYCSETDVYGHIRSLNSKTGFDPKKLF